MGKHYKLLKDLPTIKAGATFKLDDKRGLVLLKGDRDTYGPFIPNVFVLYDKAVLDICPNILKDWFEEIPERPKTVWDLGIGDAYYIPCWDDQVGFDTWLDRPKDLMRRTLGNCFLTKEEAEKELARRKAKQILLRDTKGFKPDWENTSAQDNKWIYTVYYSHREKILITNGYALSHFPCDIWFATEADAEASIKTHPNEWKTYLGVEE